MNIRQLVLFDVADWCAGKVPAAVAEVLFGLACTAGFLGVRLGIDALAPTAGPFALIYLATLVSTLFGRWLSGLVTFVTTFAWTWYFLLPPLRSFRFNNSEDAARAVVNAVTVLVVLAFAEVFRRAVRSATRERDEALSRLQDREARLDRALSAGRGIGTWDWDVPEDRVVADERFARLYGVDPVRAQAGAPFAEFFAAIHPDDAPRLQAAIDLALSKGTLLSEEYRLLQPDGEIRWVLAEGVTSPGPDGKPLRFPGVSYDITDRKLAEARLQDLNADLEHKVLERTQARGRTWKVSPDLLGALNSQGYFETSNPAWMTVLGWTEAEVAATSIWELLHPDDLERTRGGFNLTQIGQPAIHFPNRYRRKDGSYRWISWVGVPEDGLVYCSGRDITDQVEAEEALAAAREALRQSQKMESVGQLTGGIAHDFNNLLTGISGSLELAQRRIAEGRLGEIGRYLDVAEGACRRAATLTQRLLAFSRRQTLDPRPTDVNSV